MKKKPKQCYITLCSPNWQKLESQVNADENLRKKIFHTAGGRVGISIPETSLLLYNPEILSQKINSREILLVQVYKETCMRMLMSAMIED